MFEDFLKTYNYFREKGLDDSLVETLRLFNLLSDGRLSRVDLSFLEETDVGLQEIADKRKEGIPLEYIIGRVVFMGLSLYCSPDTLIPRKETELLVETAVTLLHRDGKPKGEKTVIEVGTGSGNIAIALAMNTENVRILASDICDSAVNVARRNVDLYDLGSRISLLCGDLFEPFEGLVSDENIDMVICNPPYIPTKSLEKLDPKIINHEPILALDAGAYGIDFFRKLINGAVTLLKPRGMLVFEIGAGQEKLVNMLFDKNGGYEDIEHIKDGDETRVMSAVRKQKIKTG
jgi:release factor glutamine methyltransferase